MKLLSPEIGSRIMPQCDAHSGRVDLELSGKASKLRDELKNFTGKRDSDQSSKGAMGDERGDTIQNMSGSSDENPLMKVF